jgi:single-stranded-DNA-specific exonuclease
MKHLAPQRPLCLGIECSLTGRRWLGATAAEERHAMMIGQGADIAEIVARILARRGVEPAEAAAWLAPALRDLMPDPSGLRDMDRAVERFWQAVRGRERIAIFADYDVDGGASAALLITWLRTLGLTPSLYIPDRIAEGYGPNIAAMARLGAEHDLIVCVDCGTLSHDPVAAAGCDVIILDHHLPGETLPDCVAVVNPNRHDEETDLGHLCAAAVVFLMLVAVNRRMRTDGGTGPDLLCLLDLVALATIADVAPLRGLNRAFVRQGLAVMARGARPGLRALGEVAKLRAAPTCHTLGYVFGPRVNAGGRVGAADLGARLLATPHGHEAAALAERLERLNVERRALEAHVASQALEQVEARGAPGPLVWAAGEGWHPGVVGIVASRLKEAFGRPVIVIGFDGDAGKGSGRSAGGLDLGAAIARLRGEGLIEKGGGHRAAVGLSLTRGQLAPAMARLQDLVAAAGTEPERQDTLEIDGILGAGAATVEIAEAIAAAGPYGIGAPNPRIAIAGARVTRFRPVGETHLALTLTDRLGGRLEAIAFGAFDCALGPALESLGSMPVHVAGRLERDDWGGRPTAKLHVEDAAPARD